MSKTEVPKVTIVGLQHQGYILAAGFAQMGYRVEAVASNSLDFSSLKEPDLDELIRANVKAGRLVFIPYLDLAVAAADFIFLSIDIPFDKRGVDLGPIKQAAGLIDMYRKRGSILCVTSQVSVGTTETLAKGGVAYIPELLRPGQSLENFRNADRIIVGADNPTVRTKVANLYAPLKRPIFEMDLRSAEMSKHAHNAILATQISFINEMTKICEKVGANIHDVARSTKADSRVGQNSYLNPGWTLSGGHAIRDVRVLRRLGVETPLMDAVIEVEDSL